jgi:RNA polymerase sigma factor (sigma-70 family)
MPADFPSNWEQWEQRELLADALATLPKAEAEVLWLYHNENLSFQGIADRLGISYRAARNLWAKGLKSLKKSLDENRT